jgi:hypothetical protein
MVVTFDGLEPETGCLSCGWQVTHLGAFVNDDSSCDHTDTLAITSPGCHDGTPQNAVTQSITGSLHTTGCTNHNGDPQGVNQTHQFPGPQFRIALTYDSPNNRYTGRINVEDTSGTGDNNYDDGHWDVIVERCGGSLMYQSDAVDGQTFTLTRSAEDPDVYSYETASSIPVDIRYFETSSDCTGGYLLPLKFGIYLHYDQVAGDRATLTAQAYVGTSIESAKQVYLFRNTVGVAVNSSSFVISNAATGYSCATATADIMTGGTATVTQNCTSSSSSSSSSGSFVVCDGDGSGVLLCEDVRRIETAGAQMYVTVSGVQNICTVSSCDSCADQAGTYKGVKVVSLDPNQQFLLTYVDATNGWRSTFTCEIQLYTTNDCSGSAASTVTDMDVWYRSSDNSFHIESTKTISGLGKLIVFDGSASGPSVCPLTIANGWPSDTPCGTLACQVIGGGGKAQLGGCAPSACGDDPKCGSCCQLYTIAVSGITGVNAANGMYLLQSQGGCAWSDAEPTFLSLVNQQWRLVIGNASGYVIWVAPCGVCPPTNPGAWTLVSNSFGGSPVFTISTSQCSHSSSSSGGVVTVGCDFTQNAAGGDEGFLGAYSLDTSIFGSGEQRFYFTYNTFSIPDRIIISRQADGFVFFDSGCVGSGGDVTVGVNLLASDSPIEIRVIPDCDGHPHGTAWRFHMNCQSRGQLEDMTITYDWSANTRRDMDSKTVLNITPPEQGGWSCGPNDQTYVDFGGDNTSLQTTETCIVHLGDAYLDGKWSGSTTIDLYACWYNGSNVGNNIDPWIYTISATWNGVTHTVSQTTQALNTACCSNKVCTITAHDDGSFSLSCGDGCSPLSAPANLNATYISTETQTTVSLTWNAVVGATSYQVQRSTDNSHWVAISGSVVGTTATDVPPAFLGDQPLYYRARSLTSCGSGTFGTVKSIIAKSPVRNLAAAGFVNPINSPTDGTAIQGVTLTWTNDPTSITSLVTLRNSVQQASLSLTALTWSDNTAAANTAYSYQVKAVSADGYSIATVAYTSCAAETVSNLTSQSPSPNQVVLQWDYTNTQTGATKQFEVFVSTDGGSTYVYNQTVSIDEATINGLSANTLYWFAVRAVQMENGHQCRAGLLVSDDETTISS